jgi:hypothetical protein
LGHHKRWKEHKKCGKCRCAHGSIPLHI